ncbi:MAG: hypothetical protein WC856_02505 [Methylococcaceae bacterium]
MTRHIDLQYQKRDTQDTAKFVAALKQNAVNEKGVFDSAASDAFISEAINQSAQGSVKIPEKLGIVLDEAGDRSTNITQAILDGVNSYERQHGATAPADLIAQAIHLAYATTDAAKTRYSLDSAADSNHSANLSLQPNRAIVAILSALGEAIPFAHYLPADISSNEAKLAILSHQAGNTYGAYAAGGLMDGTSSGDAYVTSSRVHATTNSSGAHSGQLTSVQATDETCTAVGGAVVAVNLLRGRTLVYVNGQVVAREINTTGSGASTISGEVTIAGVTSLIGGTINTDTGAIALTSTPALADIVPVHVEGFIDYERMPSLTPSIITAVDTFSLYAKPWRVITQQTIDSRTQMSNELGLDPYSESIIGIQAQVGNERHYQVLRMARRLGLNNTGAFDFLWSTMGLQKDRGQIWRDFAAVLGAVSQKMAVDTMSHGISHLYVGKYVAAQMQSLPSDIFQSSGISARPSVYRVGRLFGLYEVYYTPKVLTDSGSASQVMCIGRANDVTRNPFVLGDAVPSTIIPLAVNADLKSGAGYYARNFTSVNPHGPSALGCALINVTNMGM